MDDQSSRSAARSIAEAESGAARALEPRLRDHLQINSDVYNFFGLVLEGAPDASLQDVTQARKVTSCLLVRIANDLRCIGVVSLHGYADQACALAASVYEAAFAAIAIGEEETLAQEWIDHSDPNHPFRFVRDLTLMGMGDSASPNRNARLSDGMCIIHNSACPSVNAELNCHFFADADVPRLTNSLFLAPDTIAGCAGSYAVPPPDDFAESRAGAAVFS
jgi:hypothetical protein